MLVTSAARPAERLETGLGPYRVLVSDMVVITMSEPPLAEPHQVEAVRAAVPRLQPDATVIAAVLRPHPAEPVAGERVALFTTAPRPIHAAWRLPGRRARRRRHRGGRARSATARRSRADLDSPGVRAADTYLVEIKAAAIDVVAEAAEERGARVVFCDNRPRSLAGRARPRRGRARPGRRGGGGRCLACRDRLPGCAAAAGRSPSRRPPRRARAAHPGHARRADAVLEGADGAGARARRAPTRSGPTSSRMRIEREVDATAAEEIPIDQLHGDGRGHPRPRGGPATWSRATTAGARCCGSTGR